MGGENVLVTEEPPKEGESCIEDERPNKQEPNNSKARVFARGDNCHGRQDVADEGAPHVSHENPCRGPVVQQEAQAAGGNCQTNYSNRWIALSQEEPPQAGNHSLRSSNAINPVHEVVGIGQPYDPKHRDH